METILIKPIIRVGNSAGVILPSKWLNGKARVELLEKPLNINEDIIEILKDSLQDIKGVYLVGSYARNENTSESDIDVLVISEKTNKRIVSGKYDILIISESELKESIKKLPLPLVPMILEAKTIINKSLIEEYSKIKINKSLFSKNLSLINSSLKITKENIKIATINKENLSDSVSYSLILRLREILIIRGLLKGKTLLKTEFLKELNKINSLEAYSGYKRVKNNLKDLKSLSILEANILIDKISKELELT
jgi:predicted nucleotidyltransferase